MAVQEKPAEGEGGGTASPADRGKGGKGGGIGGWVKRNKLAATGVGAGALFLLLGHKGGKGEGSSALTQAQNERALAATGGVMPAAVPGTPEGGSGTVGGENGNTPGMVAPTEDPSLAAAIERLGSATGALAAAEAESATAKDASEGTQAKPAAQKPKAKKKPAAKHSAKGKPNKGHSRNGVTVHGRHFPGARGVHKGPVHKSPNGGTKQNVTVHYPGGSHTHTSHNGGEHWTDHTPGHNPPKRGTPVHSRPAPHAAPPHRPKPAPHPAVRDHRAPAHPKPKPHRRVTTA